MTSTTKNTIPAAGASFLADLQTFLREEDPDRFRDMFTGFIVSGGTHVTGAGLVHTPDSLTAYPGGHYITETGAITYPDATTHIWVICHRDTTTAVTDWTRVSGTHYLFRNTGSATEPALPVVESAILMKVTTAGGAVTVVEDHRLLGSSMSSLNIRSGSGGFMTASNTADLLVLESDSSQQGMSFLGPIGGIINVNFGDPNAVARGQIKYRNTQDSFSFFVNSGATNSLSISQAGVVINEDSGIGVDFRVESDTGTHMFFVDAGNNRAGVSLSGNLVTDGLFHIASASAGAVTANINADELVLEGSGVGGLSLLFPTTGRIAFGDVVDNDVGIIEYIHSTDTMRFLVGAVTHFTLDATGAIFNDLSTANFDFRVESDLNTHMLFVDAGNNSVHIDNFLLTGVSDSSLVMANGKFIQWVNSAGTTALNTGIGLDGNDDLQFRVPASTDLFIFSLAGATRLFFKEENSGIGINFNGESSTDHAAPVANACVLYITDTGGKTQLVARFATGAVQQIAVEP